MRNPINQTTDALIAPTAAQRSAAAAQWGQPIPHAEFETHWQALRKIEYCPPENAIPTSPSLTITAWNIERCKRINPSAALIAQCDADIVLATEMDYGMARSSQFHTSRELAKRLGFGYAFGVEFVELGLGTEREKADCAGMTNQQGLHGNAILSRWPLSEITLIPLDAGGLWFEQAPKKNSERRVGGRCAIAATIATPEGRLLVVCVHYESETDAEGRRAQTDTLLTTLESCYGSGPAIIGGDFNTQAFLPARYDSQTRIDRPESVEPSFSMLREYGYEWHQANTGCVTTRETEVPSTGRAMQTLDWLFCRDVICENPFVAAAVTDDGQALSDHELIGVKVCLAPDAGQR